MAIERFHPLRRGTHVVAVLAWLAAVGCSPAENPDPGSDPRDAAQAPPNAPPIVAIDSSAPPFNRPIWIEGGSFVMGTDDSYPTRGPAHEVTVSSFWIQEHEVTNAEFRAFDPTHRSVSGPNDHPVAYVQWREAMAYAESLGGSLPTEAQWEYAARGREGRTYPWGEAEPTCALAHYDACGSRGTLPVMSLPGGATPEGVYDLAGNVMEWMSDRYGPYAAGPVSNPTGPSEGDRRVLRGGGWMLDTLYLPATSRTSWPEVERPAEVDGTPHIGFRVVWPGDAGPDSPPRTN